MTKKMSNLMILDNSGVIDLNSRREFNYYRRTSILLIIEEL